MEPVLVTSYSLENEKQWQKDVNEALKLFGDLTQPFKLIARDFYKSEQSIFGLKSAGQYPDFKSEKGKKAKIKRRGFAYPLLLAEGRLMRSVTDPSAAGAFLNIQKTFMQIGTDVKTRKGISYPLFHQLGGKIIPERKFLFIGPEAPRFATDETNGRLERWQKTMKEFVDKKLKSMGKVK